MAINVYSWHHIFADFLKIVICYLFHLIFGSFSELSSFIFRKKTTSVIFKTRFCTILQKNFNFGFFWKKKSAYFFKFCFCNNIETVGDFQEVWKNLNQSIRVDNCTLFKVQKSLISFLQIYSFWKSDCAITHFVLHLKSAKKVRSNDGTFSKSNKKWNHTIAHFQRATKSVIAQFHFFKEQQERAITH